MTLFLAILMAAQPVSCAVPPAEEARQLALAYTDFDSVPGDSGWRSLNGRGCVDAAVRLLAAYERLHRDQLATAQASELAFHQGQALAFAGRDSESLFHFERALGLGGTAEWINYVGATIAFLRKDDAGLRRARENYAAIAPGSMRLKIIDGFLACPGQAYMKAAHCAM
jgi:hypothetical protein